MCGVKVTDRFTCNDRLQLHLQFVTDDIITVLQ